MPALKSPPNWIFSQREQTSENYTPILHPMLRHSQPADARESTEREPLGLAIVPRIVQSAA